MSAGEVPILQRSQAQSQAVPQVSDVLGVWQAEVGAGLPSPEVKDSHLPASLLFSVCPSGGHRVPCCVTLVPRSAVPSGCSGNICRVGELSCRLAILR